MDFLSLFKKILLFPILFILFTCSVKIPGTISYKVLTNLNNSSFGKCFNANSLWHVYLGSVFLNTACPYPGITL
jgi:hypothetical protein